MTHTITPTHSYRATLVPADLPAEDVQASADAGALPTLRLRATDSDHARRAARAASGMRVLNVERIEPAAPAEAA